MLSEKQTKEIAIVAAQRLKHNIFFTLTNVTIFFSTFFSSKCIWNYVNTVTTLCEVAMIWNITRKMDPNMHFCKQIKKSIFILSCHDS